jgi:hypothetical protein
MLVPRRSRAHATIELECEPFLPTRVTTQEMNAVLNGVLLGTVRLREGWQSVAFEAPPRAWQIGVNELVLSFSSAAAPRDFGDGDDGRKLSVAFDRLTVRSR